jgi:hypothetical protein
VGVGGGAAILDALQSVGIRDPKMGGSYQLLHDRLDADEDDAVAHPHAHVHLITQLRWAALTKNPSRKSQPPFHGCRFRFRFSIRGRPLATRSELDDVRRRQCPSTHGEE